MEKSCLFSWLLMIFDDDWDYPLVNMAAWEIHELNLEVSSWENHGTIWWIFQQTTFDCPRIKCVAKSCKWMCIPLIDGIHY